MKKGMSQLELYTQFRPMIMKLAWKYWRQLPVSAKMWVDPEDFIAEAILHVVGFVRKNHDASRASVSSFLYCTVGSHLFNFVLAQRTSKRFGWMVSISEENCPVLIQDKEHSLQLVESKNVLERIYLQASPKLKSEMCKWFGWEKRAHSNSKKTQLLIQEFAFLAKKNRLSESDCRLLLRSGIWVP